VVEAKAAETDTTGDDQHRLDDWVAMAAWAEANAGSRNRQARRGTKGVRWRRQLRTSHRSGWALQVGPAPPLTIEARAAGLRTGSGLEAPETLPAPPLRIEEVKCSGEPC